MAVGFRLSASQQFLIPKTSPFSKLFSFSLNIGYSSSLNTSFVLYTPSFLAPDFGAGNLLLLWL